MPSFTYIDIHTHRPRFESNIFSIQNLQRDFQQYNSLFYYSAGIHPRFINEQTIDEDYILLKKSLLSDHFLAIGECGLDRLSDTPFHTQEKIFARQIQIANELAKPLLIHCVRAHREVIQLLNDHRVNVPVIFHGFNNKYDFAKQILDQGYYLSFGKSITNPIVQQTFLKLPADKLFMETDAGPLDIETIYQHASQLRQISLYDWQLQIRQNFIDIFPNLPA